MSLREALDLLSTEDGLLNRISRHNADEFVEAVAVVCAVGRRFLALTETVDEWSWWCERHNAGQFKDFPWCAYAAPDGPTTCNLIPVHVIPADYLTEEADNG